MRRRQPAPLRGSRGAGRQQLRGGFMQQTLTRLLSTGRGMLMDRLCLCTCARVQITPAADCHSLIFTTLPGQLACVLNGWHAERSRVSDGPCHLSAQFLPGPEGEGIHKDSLEGWHVLRGSDKPCTWARSSCRARRARASTRTAWRAGTCSRTRCRAGPSPPCSPPTA